MKEQSKKDSPESVVPPSFPQLIIIDPILFFSIFVMTIMVIGTTVALTLGYTPQNMTLSKWRYFSLPNLIALHLFFTIFPVVMNIRGRAIRNLGFRPDMLSGIFLIAPYMMWILSGGLAMTSLLSLLMLSDNFKVTVDLFMNVWEYYEYLYKHSTFYFIHFHAVFFFVVIFGPTAILDRIIVSPAVRHLEQLGKTILELRQIKVESDDWTDDKWRKKAIEKNKTDYNGPVEDLCSQWLEQWQVKRNHVFHLEAFLAITFLGEKNYEEVRQMFLKDNMEQIMRWSVVTGKDIPL